MFATWRLETNDGVKAVLEFFFRLHMVGVAIDQFRCGARVAGSNTSPGCAALWDTEMGSGISVYLSAPAGVHNDLS